MPDDPNVPPDAFASASILLACAVGAGVLILAALCGIGVQP